MLGGGVGGGVGGCIGGVLGEALGRGSRGRCWREVVGAGVGER